MKEEFEAERLKTLDELIESAEREADGQGGIMVDGLHVPEHGLYAKRGGLRFGER